MVAIIAPIPFFSCLQIYNPGLFLLRISTHVVSWMRGIPESFCPFCNVLNNTSKKLLASGVWAMKKQAKVITPDEEDVLWSKGINQPTHLPCC